MAGGAVGEQLAGRSRKWGHWTLVESDMSDVIEITQY